MNAEQTNNTADLLRLAELRGRIEGIEAAKEIALERLPSEVVKTWNVAYRLGIFQGLALGAVAGGILGACAVLIFLGH
jgi:hypothetical protein